MALVAFVIRDDSALKSGGDVDLARSYARLINDSSEFQCEIIRTSDLKRSNFDCAVLFNLDQPFEAYIAARLCVAARVPFLLYSLHHKFPAVRHFLRHATRGLQSLVALLSLYSPSRYETAMGLMRIVAKGAIEHVPIYREMGFCARFLLTHATSLVVSSEEEVEYIRSDFCASVARYAIIPHTFERPLTIRNIRQGSRSLIGPVLCAGRIEPRKNQLAIASFAAAHPDLHFIFVGKKNARHRSYVQLFEGVVAASSNIDHIDQVSVSELHSKIAQAAVYVNLSWFEVFSLIDLMALSIGTPAILSNGSYLYEQYRRGSNFGNVRFTDPRNPLIYDDIRASASDDASSRLPAFENLLADQVREKWVALLRSVIHV